MATVATAFSSTENATFPVGAGVDFDVTSTSRPMAVVEVSSGVVEGAVNFTVAAAFTVIETLIGPAAA
jgi:hypothetical protein